MVQPPVQLQPEGPPVILVQDLVQTAPMIGAARTSDGVPSTLYVHAVAEDEAEGVANSMKQF
jgi:hypothetical protein